MNSAQGVHADATDNANSAETSTETSVDKTPQSLNIVGGQHGTTAEQSTPETGSGGAGQADRSLSNEESNAKNKPVDQK